MKCVACGADKVELRDGRFIKTGYIMAPVPIDSHGHNFKSTGIAKHEFHCKDCVVNKEEKKNEEPVATDW